MQAPLLALGSCLTHGLEVSTIPLGFWVLMNEGVGLEQSPGIHPAGKAVIADSAALCLLLCGPGLRDFFFFLKSFLNLSQYYFWFLFFFFCQETCGILSPRQGIKPAPLALEGKVLKPLDHQENSGPRAI